MKIKAPKKALSSVLARVGSIVSSKSQHPALACVLVDAGERLVLRSSDSLITMNDTVTTATIEKAGAIALPFKSFAQLVNAMPEGDVTVAVKDQTATIAGGNRKLKLKGLDANDFPRLDAWEPKRVLEVNPATLAKIIRRVQHAASDDASRPHISGVAIFAEEAKIHAAATDGACFGWTWEGINHSLPFETVLIANKACKAICDLCDAADAEHEVVEFAVGLSRMRASLPWGSIDAALPDAPFVPFRNALPKESECSFKAEGMPALALADGLAALSVTADEGKESGVRIIANGKLRLEAEGKETSGVDEIECDAVGELNVLVGARRIISALRSAVDDLGRASLLAGGDMDPVVVKSDDYTGVVMPMRGKSA